MKKKYNFVKLKELRANSKETLLDNVGLCILITIIFYILKFTITLCTLSGSILSSGAVGLIINELIDFISNGFYGLLQVAICSFFLRLSSKKRFSSISPEQTKVSAPDKIVLISLLIAAIRILAYFPFNAYTIYITNTASIITNSIAINLRLTLLLIAVYLISYIATLPFALVYFIIIDMPSLSIKQTLKMSFYLMKGVYWRYIRMQLSLLPLWLLAILSCGIGFLWVSPYTNLVYANFYREVSSKKAEA